MTSVPADRDWWRTAVVYEIYPRSFADSNADGIGDLQGVRSRLTYLEELGVDALWLTPVYPSPLADGGYDICDHRDIDPRLGTLSDFDELVADAHRHGIRIIMDIVPNHTSDQHPWFREALASPVGSAARDRYVFRPTRPDGAPPSDWRSHFGGSAWEQLPDGDAYLHLFAAEQPDLNWDDQEVRDYFLGTLRFWADRGVDGFRIDTAHTLAKDLSEPLRSQPRLDSHLPDDGSDPVYDRDETHEIYRSWRRALDAYDPPRMAVAEAPPKSRTHLYARADELGQVFDFVLLKTEWNARLYGRTIRRCLADYAAAGGSVTWVLSSHDVPRHASRLALPAGVDPHAWLLSSNTDPVVDAEVGLRRATAATLLLLALPGTAYLYQGEELGLPEVADLSTESIQDPIWAMSGHTQKGRDGCRVPLPWTRSGASLGFGANGSWLPQPTSFGSYSVEAQSGAAGSTLELYRAALATRRRLQTRDSLVSWLPSDDPDLLHFRRSNGWECIVNFSGESKSMPEGRALLSSQPVQSGRLAGESAVWLVGRP